MAYSRYMPFFECVSYALPKLQMTNSNLNAEHRYYMEANCDDHDVFVSEMFSVRWIRM